MQRIITILLLSLVWASHAHAATWTKLQDNKHVKMMLDKASITTSGKYQKAWVKVDYKALQTNLHYPEKHYNNAKLLWYFNCAEQKSATAQVYQLLNEEQIYSAAIDVKRARFLEPVPETEVDIAMHYVCKQKADAEAKAEKKARAAEAAKNKPPTPPEPKKKVVKPAPPPPAPAPVPTATEPKKADGSDQAAETNAKGKESKDTPKAEDEKADKKKFKADKKHASEKDKHAKKDEHGKKDKHLKEKKKTKKHGKDLPEDEEHDAEMNHEAEHEADEHADDHDKATSKKQSKKKHKKKKDRKSKKKKHKSKKHEDDAEKHAAPKVRKDTHWQYSGSKGPLFWGEMNTDYATCKTGSNQSPIDISKAIDATLKPLKTFQRFPVDEMVNLGHTVQANFKPGNILVVDGVLYQMKYVTFHAPSENQIMGKSFPLEAHFVHADPKDKLAVLAVMFEEGHQNTALTKLWKQIPKSKNKPKKAVGKVLAGDLLPRKSEYYRFSGSLTTPPCQEGVVWVVMKTPMTASKQQIDAYKKAIKKHNNRPIQPLNGRIIVE